MRVTGVWPTHQRKYHFISGSSNSEYLIHKNCDGFTVAQLINHTKSYNKINGWVYTEELLPFKGLSEWMKPHVSSTAGHTSFIRSKERHITAKWRDENHPDHCTLPLLIQRQKEGSQVGFHSRSTNELLYNYDPFSIKRKQLSKDWN